LRCQQDAVVALEELAALVLGLARQARRTFERAALSSSLARSQGIFLSSYLLLSQQRTRKRECKKASLFQQRCEEGDD